MESNTPKPLTNEETKILERLMKTYKSAEPFDEDDERFLFILDDFALNKLDKETEARINATFAKKKLKEYGWL